MLTHANIVSNAYATVHHLGLTADDRGLCAVPMFHCFGQNFIMNALVTAGAQLVIHPRFVPDAFREAVVRHRITLFYGVPAMYIVFLATERTLDFASIRLFFSAAATLPLDVERRWSERYGRRITQGYGLTECSPFAAWNHDVDVRVRSEEHTSELQSPCNLVCRLLLEKKKKTSTSQAPIKPTANHVRGEQAHRARSI